MKRNQKIAALIVSVLGLAAAGAASAHMGGPGMGGWGHMGGAGAPVAQLMTLEERTALREKMINAKTPEERFAIAQANREEIQKRAAEKGITLPACGPGVGPGAGAGPGAGVGPGAGFGPGACAGGGFGPGYGRRGGMNYR